MKRIRELPLVASFVAVAVVLGFIARGAELSPSQEARAREISEKMLRRPGSFHRLVLSSRGGPIMAELSDRRPGCGEAVRRMYARGGSLYSPEVDQAAVRLGDFPKGSGVQDDTYYHYTRLKAFMKQFRAPESRLQRDQAYEKIFVFLRTKPARLYSPAVPNDYTSNWGRVFYVSEDPDTIRFFAPFQIVFKIRDDARLVTLDRALFTRALEDIGSRYPEVGRACGTTLDTSIRDQYATVVYHALVFMIAEDSGIDAIDYGMANHWFQVLSGDIFQHADPRGRRGGSVSGEDTRSDLPEVDLAFLDEPVISVESALYGADDATLAAGNLLDGKTRFDFPVSEAKGRDLKIKWKCLKGGDARRSVGSERSVSIVGRGDGDGRTAEVSCL